MFAIAAIAAIVIVVVVVAIVAIVAIVVEITIAVAGATVHASSAIRQGR